MSDRRYILFLVPALLLLGAVAAWAQPRALLSRLPQADNAGHKVTRKLKINKKPNPQYTEEARSRGIEGVVVLRVEFKADGTIGDIKPVKALSGGLTEKAIEAARLIEFEPQMVDDQPSSKTLTVTYRFNLH
ncbi:MAG TPA: energy transducer TonB [Pyrinomonadaceae bacterium]|jgi:TonB family protein